MLSFNEIKHNQSLQELNQKEQVPELGQTLKLDIKPEEIIVITHYVSPQLFFYTTLEQLESNGDLVIQVELKLTSYCHAKNQRDSYASGQHVIVRYMSLKMKKLMRAVVIACQQSKCLVLALDYGFTLNCRAKDLWLLPQSLCEKFIDMGRGGLAGVAPSSAKEWSEKAVRLLDQKLEEALFLVFKPQYINQEQHSFGKLLLNSPGQLKTLLDAASLLVEMQCAEVDTNQHTLISADQGKSVFEIQFSELNGADKQPSKRAATILELMEMQYKEELPLAKIALESFVNPNNSVSKSNDKDKNALSYSSNGYHKLGATIRALKYPTEQLGRLDIMLAARKVLKIPDSAKRLSKVQSRDQRSVETALQPRPSTTSKYFYACFETEELQVINKRNFLDLYKQPSLSPLKANLKIKTSNWLQQNFSLLNNEQAITKYKEKHSEKLDRVHKELSGLTLNHENESLNANQECEKIEVQSLTNIQVAKNIFKIEKKPQEQQFANKPKKLTLQMSQIEQEPQPQSATNSQSENKIQNAVKSPMFSKDTLSLILKSLPLQENHLRQSKDHSHLDKVYNKYRPMPSTKSMSVATGHELSHLKSMLLVHSKVPVLPLSCSSETIFCPDVHNAMQKMSIQVPQPKQNFSWPHIMRGNSLVLVDRIGSGRSWAYLPTLCSLVMRSMRIPTGTPQIGPLAVLLTDLVDNAHALSKNCNTLMKAFTTPLIKLVNTHAHAMHDVVLMLLNSCGILVTTMSHLKHILQHGLGFIDRERVMCCVVDDYDRMRRTVPDLLNEVLQLLQNIAPPQLVLVAQQWHAGVFVELAKRSGRNPLLLFGDFLEAAIYGNLKLDVVVQRSDKKTQQLLDYLAIQMPKRRTLIYCKNDMELAALQNTLTCAGYECIRLDEAANQQIHHLLLVTDALKKTQLSLRNFELMVHYSLPETWPTFSYRFHALSDNINNCLTTRQFNQGILSCVMLDENDSCMLILLVQFLDAHNISVGDNVRQMVASYRCLKDQSRQFCPRMLSSGECTQIYCSNRHFTISGDFSGPMRALWQPGTVVRCKLIQIYDPVHIAVMAVSYKRSDLNSDSNAPSWQETKNLSALRQQSMALQIHMNMEQNRRIQQKPNISETCIIKHGIRYQRVNVVDLSEERLVAVQLMDEGTELLKVKSTELYECDERFKVELPLAMDVRLFGLMPNESNGNWQSGATKLVCNALNGLRENQHIQLIVEFSMFNVIYVKDITVAQECPTLKVCVKTKQIHDELVKKGFGKRAEQSIIKLRNIYQEFASEQQIQEQEINSFKDYIELEDELLNEKTASEAVEDKLVSEEAACAALEDELVNEETAGENLKDELVTQETSSATLEDELVNQMAAGAALENELVNEETVTETVEDELVNEETAGARLEDELVNQEAAGAALKDELVNEETATPNLLNMFLQELNSKEPELQDAAQQMVLNMLQAYKDIFAVPTTNQKVTADISSSVLCCSAIDENALRPRVKWHQTLLHIELIIEQQLPEYQLKHHGNVLIYEVNKTTPPHRCILCLLGEVKILSQQQNGYELRVKLAKHGLKMCWPILLSSLNTQKYSSWLVYDTDRGRAPLHDNHRLTWLQYDRSGPHQVKKDDDDEKENEDFDEDDDNDLDFLS